jgi:probable F420-dependent oxidoreductase
MHIGISRPPTPPRPIPDVDAALIAQLAEEAGFESVFYGEHPFTPVHDRGYVVHSSGVPFYQDTLVALARASGATTRITLGSGVFLLPLHHPVMFAKQLASLDYYSGGRLVAGVGLGWSRIEAEATGANFDRRWSQTRESIELMKRLWSEDGVEHHGEFFDFEPISIDPKPRSKPSIPILLPGPHTNNTDPLDSPKNIRYFERMAQNADGWIPAMLGNQRMEEGVARVGQGIELLDRLCREVGRDPSEMRITALLRTEIHDEVVEFPELVSKDLLHRYEDLGIERAVVTIPTVTDEKSAREVVERSAELLL